MSDQPNVSVQIDEAVKDLVQTACGQSPVIEELRTRIAALEDAVKELEGAWLARIWIEGRE